MADPVGTVRPSEPLQRERERKGQSQSFTHMQMAC